MPPSLCSSPWDTWDVGNEQPTLESFTEEASVKTRRPGEEGGFLKVKGTGQFLSCPEGIGWEAMLSPKFSLS